MVPDDTLPIRERAVAAWPSAWQGQNLRDILTTLGHDVDMPWRKLPKKLRDWISFTDEQPTVPVYAGCSRAEAQDAIQRKLTPSYMGTFTGARRHVLHTFANSQSALMKKRVAQYLVGAVCPSCRGKRLKPEAPTVSFAGLDIGALSQLPLTALAERLRPTAEGQMGEAESAAASTTQPESSALRPTPHTRPRPTCVARTGGPKRRCSLPSTWPPICAKRVLALIDLELGCLSLDRTTPTLSPGELQRLLLASQLSSHLFGMVYVLDEPSAGLHPADGEALLTALQGLNAAGNSLL